MGCKKKLLVSHKCNIMCRYTLLIHTILIVNDLLSTGLMIIYSLLLLPLMSGSLLTFHILSISTVTSCIRTLMKVTQMSIMASTKRSSLSTAYASLMKNLVLS